jgi:hypothetical protein
VSEKKAEAPPSVCWIDGKIGTAKDHVERYYDDEMCAFLDPTAKPTQIRSSILNELGSKKDSPRTVSWDPVLKRAVSR